MDKKYENLFLLTHARIICVSASCFSFVLELPKKMENDFDLELSNH